MTMQIIKDLEQGSAEWLEIRMGIVTMSNMSALLVNGKGEEGFGAEAFTYMNTLIGERITQEIADPFTGNRHTERGHELEPKARALYEMQTDHSCEQVAIILNHGCGYSPDSLVGADGLNEIKTKLPKYQVELILSGEVPKEHLAQCQGGLWISGREWIDFISYWPGMPLFVKRLHRDEAMIRKMAERAKTFYELLEDRMNRVLGIEA
jgi:hypothetical protein